MDVKDTYFQLNTWFNRNLLSLNVDKTHFNISKQEILLLGLQILEILQIQLLI
jgi:hypothetical protein